MAGIYYSKVAIVDNAKYYYVSREDSACRKNIYQKFNDEKYAISQIISMINDANITKEHYVIIYSYLARYIISLSSFFVNHALKKEYADFCTHMCVQCKYPREQIEHYIYEQGLIQARLNRKVISYELRKKIKNK